MKELSKLLLVNGSSDQFFTLACFVPSCPNGSAIFAGVWHKGQEWQVESRYRTRYLYTGSWVVSGSAESGGSVYLLNHPSMPFKSS